MAWWQNLPLALILGPMMCAVACSVLKGRVARWAMAGVSALCCVGMGTLLFYTASRGVSYVYSMGAIGAPFGNELRAGPAEAQPHAAVRVHAVPDDGVAFRHHLYQRPVYRLCVH